MAKKSNTAKNQIEGRWRITWMVQWDQNYVDEEVEGFIEFKPHNSGELQFGYIQGFLDCRLFSQDKQPAVDFSWEGGDAADGTPLTGRGSAILNGDELKGTIFIHNGDDSEFKAIRKKK